MVKNAVNYTVVDAFTDTPFKGNPAAVCLLDREKTDEWLQSVAKEFNISETCYLTPINIHTPIPRFGLRWFTPATEVELCGHATLAAAHVLFTAGFVKSNIVEFSTLSGILTAKKILRDGMSNEMAEVNFSIELDFPTALVVNCDPSEIPSIPVTLNGAEVICIKKVAATGDLIVELASGEIVTNLHPHIEEIHNCPGRGLIITGIAPTGSGFDFISRFFCPKFGINEDPVCGSAHCALAPYWSQKLGKSDFIAYMASPRGGVLDLHLNEKSQRVFIRGKAVTVMAGSLFV